ncbi:MAG: flagellar hook-length control protein FliK [Geobacteraceae bacterium]|nr:flagellar hook-length control protein FliK [Geobacteraceae bacterium]
MHTLPFMHTPPTSGSGNGSRPLGDTSPVGSGERSSFEPAMRDAASRNRMQNTSARNDSSNNNTQGNSDIARQEHSQNGRDEDLAGAAVAKQDSVSRDKGANPRLEGTRDDNAPSTRGKENTGELADAAERSTKSPSQAQESGVVLTAAESEKLQKHLKSVIQILEQNTAKSEIAAELQDFMRSIKNSASLSEAIPRPNLSEAQAQTLEQILQSTREGASLSESIPRLNLSEAQAQKLQDILATLKNMNQAGSLDSSIREPQQLNAKLTDLIAQLEQTLRTSQQSAQVQNGVAQLKQPEIVDGFVLRAEKDKDGLNGASKVDDPRFAALLNKSTQFSSLRERQGQQNSASADLFSARMSGTNPQEQAQSLIQQARAEMAATNSGSNGEAGKSLSEGQAQFTSANASTSAAAADLMGMKGMAEAASARDNAAVDFSAAQKGTGIGNNSTDPGILTLKNGATMPTARVVDQTIQHLNLHSRGDSSVVTVKLYPEELGELNIRMVMEGDQLKLQIQAQNQQVREILEQNFPRLRNAMEDQGVTVEDFQVSLGDSRAEDQAGTQDDEELSRHREAGGGSNDVAVIDSEEDGDIESSARVTSPGGLSVHV